MPNATPHVAATPATPLEGQPVMVSGTGWPDCPLHLTLRGKPRFIERIARGYRVEGGVRPIAGAFALRIATYGLAPGRHALIVTGGGMTQTCALEIRARPRPSRQEEDDDVGLAYWRYLDLYKPRVGQLGYVPEGILAARERALAQLRQRQGPSRATPIARRPAPSVFYTKPVQGGTNWTPAGPAPIVAGAASTNPAWGGRVLSLAVDPMLSSRVYVGTASAGIWRSTDGGATWSSRTDDQPGLAIGALAIDPNSPNRVFAGTGEFDPDGTGTAFWGAGLLYSSDFGDTWSPIPGSGSVGIVVARIVFDPGNTAQHMLLAGDNGVYESTDGGVTWNLLISGTVTDLVINPTAGGLKAIAAFYAGALQTSTLSGGTWSAWQPITDSALPSPFAVGRIALGQSRNHPDQIWAAFSTFTGDANPATNVALTGIAKSADSGQTWSKVGLPDASIVGQLYQGNYNLVVAVHPDTPDTVYLGMNILLQTQTGDAPWISVENTPAFPHADQHAVAFDPANPNNVFVGNDGGVFYSTDGGGSWNHRNRGLGTLQLYRLANHPTWAAIMLAGTQDNGGVFATGAPAWQRDQWPGQSFNTLDGDVTVTAIDPVDPNHAYYISYLQLFHSSNFGQTWGLVPVHTFAPQTVDTNLVPFLLDAVTSGVCYAGADVVLRSSDFGSTFTPITASLNGKATALAIHPQNPDILYVGTSLGSVYRVQRTGPDWQIPNVTLSDVTGFGTLPLNQHVSCLAIDSTGSVWVTFSFMLDPGDLASLNEKNVFFLPAGSTFWEQRTFGLLLSDPVNALAIDPTDDSVVFCGTDSRVFRWNPATSLWDPWDEGLPATPVFQLSIHAPSRLLRATTYGRGVWERSIDPVVQPMVDIYMRDNILDDGRGPAPNGVPHPFAPNNLVWWWQSEDIKVDTPPFQTPMPATDDVTLANQVQHQNPQRGVINRFYVQVHNRGPLTATNILVRAFFTDASMGVPNFPADFWDAPKPFLADPSAAEWTPIGAAIAAGDLEPGHTAVVVWEWLVPQSAAQHSCLVAIATCDEDALSLPGHFSVTDIVVNQNNITQKNLHVVP